jgi:hypothetical protein
MLKITAEEIHYIIYQYLHESGKYLLAFAGASASKGLVWVTQSPSTVVPKRVLRRFGLSVGEFGARGGALTWRARQL